MAGGHAISKRLAIVGEPAERARSRTGRRAGDVVTPRALIPLVEQYRAGLDAELMLLHRLLAISVDQRRTSETGSVADMQATVDSRDRVMATLVTVEQELKGLRQQLVMFREYLAEAPAFQELVALHRQAADLVADIISVDQDSIQALENAKRARHIGAQAPEQGESRLPHYRRVVTPTLASATLVNRRG